MKHLWTFACMLVGFAPSLTHAEDVYQGRDRQGRTVYQSTPEGLSNPRRLDIIAPPVVTRPPVTRPSNTSSSTTPTPFSSSSSPASAPDPLAQRKAVRDAQEALETALRAQQEGAEPLEGERQGAAHAVSRLSPAYFERQSTLARQVESARQALENAQRN